MSVSLCLPNTVAVSAFMICRGLCACTEILWMCVLYVSFGSRLLIYSAGSDVNRVEVVSSEFSMRCFVLSRQTHM